MVKTKQQLYAVLIITLTLNLTTFSAALDWWEDASLYQIYPRSWKDSDGNGIGDLKGITENLDYLKEIGITATWLSPIFKSILSKYSNQVSLFGGSMWKWNKNRQQFYLHQFLNKQPNFNFRNEKVHEKMFEVMKFWLDRGIDGFRLDAVPLMYEKVFQNGTYPDENPKTFTYTQNQYETVELLYSWRKFLDTYQKQNGGDTRVLLAESYSPIEWLDTITGNGTHNGVHVPFNFAFFHLNTTSNARNVGNLVDWWMNSQLTGNHDSVRIIELIGQNKTDLMYFLLTALPGITITYYGEEIGMSNGDICKNCPYNEERKNERTPFQWNNSTSAGFSSSNNTWLPVNKNYKNVNVQNQLASKKSPLRLFIALQKLKKTPAFKAFKDKNGLSYGAVNDNVFQIIRRSCDEEYRFLINFGDNEEDIGDILNSRNVKNNLMEYRVVSRNSPHTIGYTVELADIKLMPVEGVALRRVYKNENVILTFIYKIMYRVCFLLNIHA